MSSKNKLLADILLDYIDKMQTGEDLLKEDDEEEDIFAEPSKPKISITALKLPKMKKTPSPKEKG
jgi:hypothetical protein